MKAHSRKHFIKTKEVFHIDSFYAELKSGTNMDEKEFERMERQFKIVLNEMTNNKSVLSQCLTNPKGTFTSPHTKQQVQGDSTLLREYLMEDSIGVGKGCLPLGGDYTNESLDAVADVDAGMTELQANFRQTTACLESARTAMNRWDLSIRAIQGNYVLNVRRYLSHTGESLDVVQ